MSDKKLLNENTIRRFMKLANVDTMTDNFISEMGKAYKMKHADDKELEETVAEEEVVEEATDEDVVEEEIELTTEEEDMAADDMGDDMEMDAEMGDMDAVDEGDADISLTEEEAQLLIDLGSRLEAAMGADEGEPEMDIADEPMDDEPEMDEEEPMDDMAAEDEPEDDAMMQEEIVNEVLKRVTQRIIREKMKRK